LNHETQVDNTKCTVTVCESFARSVFETNDGGDLVLKSDAVPAGMLDDVRQAVNGCPNGR
jgi:ferredoxin